MRLPRRPRLLLLLGALPAFGAANVARAEEPPPLPPPEQPSAPLPPLPPASAAPAQPAPPAQPSTPAAAPPPVLAPSASPPPPAAPAPPRELSPWDPDTPVPDGYVLRSRPQTGLIFGGAAMVSIAWVTSIAVGLVAAEDEEDRGIDGDGVEADDWTPLFVPIGGPFASIVSVDSGGVGTGLLLADGALQAAGVALIVVGSLVQDHRVVRVSPDAVSVTVAPTLSASARGLVLGGAF